jgi:hypothetical protein
MPGIRDIYNAIHNGYFIISLRGADENKKLTSIIESLPCCKSENQFRNLILDLITNAVREENIKILKALRDYGIDSKLDDDLDLQQHISRLENSSNEDYAPGNLFSPQQNPRAVEISPLSQHLSRRDTGEDNTKRHKSITEGSSPNTHGYTAYGNSPDESQEEDKKSLGSLEENSSSQHVVVNAEKTSPTTEVKITGLSTISSSTESLQTESEGMGGRESSHSTSMGELVTKNSDDDIELS